MKRIFAGALAALLSFSAIAATTVPVQLLNPTGSTSGQVIRSTGPTSAPAWGNVAVTALAAQASNTVVANVTGSGASPTAFAMPSCSTSSSSLNWTAGTGFTCNTSVNAAQLGGATFAAPGPIGSTTASTGAFTTLSASSTVSGTGFSTYLASPPAIGGTTPAAGTFTTLKGNSLAKVFATNTSAQSIPSAANTAVTGWTAGIDVNSNFTTSTGTFTAPTTGYYVVTAQLTWGAIAGAGASGQLKATVYVNGSPTTLQGFAPMSNTTQQTNVVQVSGIVNVTSGQTIVLNAFQNSGSAVALSNSVGAVWMNVYQLP